MNRNVINTYGDFVSSRFYYEQYNVVPSSLELETWLRESAENMQKVLDALTREVQSEILFEKWKVSKYKGDEESKDHRNHYFVVIDEKSVCVDVQLVNEMLFLHFLYDVKEKKSADWVYDKCKEIRDLVGKVVSPTFKVLANNGRGFYVEEINVSKIEMDIEKHYNDDFAEIDTIIKSSLKEDQSGLILLHGKPGTGKTSYIKHLLIEHGDKNFIFIPNDLVRELLQPQFVSFLLTQKNSVLVIEDAEKVISSREKANEHSVVSTILQLTDGLFSDYLNIKVICTFNTNLSNIDSALFRKGRMIAFYEFKALSLEKTNRLLNNDTKAKEGMTIAEIYHSNARDFNQSEKTIGFNKK